MTAPRRASGNKTFDSAALRQWMRSRSAVICGFFAIAALATSFVAPQSRAATVLWDNYYDGLDGSNTNFNYPFNWGVGQTGSVPGTTDNATFSDAAVVSP